MHKRNKTRREPIPTSAIAASSKSSARGDVLPCRPCTYRRMHSFFDNSDQTRRYKSPGGPMGQVPVTGGHFGGGSCSGCQYPTVGEVPVCGGQYIGIKILIYGASSINKKNADGGTQETARWLLRSFDAVRSMRSIAKTFRVSLDTVQRHR